MKFERFTAFRHLDFVPPAGINAIVGANGTGKTHLMKVAYAACDVSKTKAPFAQKLVRLFLPSGRSLGRLVRRQQGSSRCSVAVYRDETRLRASFSNHATVPDSATITGAVAWASEPVQSVYIPVKEMLANSPGFRSLYAQREIHFEEIYSDILDRAHLPLPRGAPDQARRRLLDTLQKTIAGKVTVKDEEFFLRNKQGNLEFTLLAEGMRKLGLLDRHLKAVDFRHRSERRKAVPRGQGPENPEALPERSERFISKFLAKELDVDLVGKLRDSLLYE